MVGEWYNAWSIVHVLWYILFALFIPNNWWFIIIISIIWELFEYIMSNHKYFDESIMNRICDIIFNLIGYYIGSILYAILKN